MYLVYVTIYIVGINNVVINNCINVIVTNATQLNYETNSTHNSDTHTFILFSLLLSQTL